MLFFGPMWVRSVLRFLTIIFVVLANVESQSQQQNLLGPQDHKLIVKRGDGSKNDYGPSIFVYSDILRLDDTAPSSSGSKSTGYGKVMEDPWQGSGLMSDSEVWLETDGDSQNYQPIQEHVDFTTNIFSTDPQQSADIKNSGVSSSDGHLTAVLHTQPSDCRGQHTYSTGAVSGNVDFSGLAANLTNRHSSLSYGR